MRESGFDQSLLDHIDLNSRYSFKCQVSRDSCNSVVPRRPQFWIPLPFHPVYVKAIKSSLGKLSRVVAFQQLSEVVFGARTGLGAAWKLRSEPLANIVGKF